MALPFLPPAVCASSQARTPKTPFVPSPSPLGFVRGEGEGGFARRNPPTKNKEEVVGMEDKTKPENKHQEEEVKEQEPPAWPVPDEEIDRVIRLLEEGWMA